MQTRLRRPASCKAVLVGLQLASCEMLDPDLKLAAYKIRGAAISAALPLDAGCGGLGVWLVLDKSLQMPP